MSIENKSICPCCIGTDKETSYQDCCESLHLKKIQAQSAKILMRSRYSAFHLGLGEYIYETHHPDFRRNATVEDYTQSAVSTDWCCLEVLKHEPNEKHAIVEFKAFYFGKEKKKLHALHEISNFVKDNDRWLYTDGQYQPKSEIKIPRNDLCPCHSGLKAKKCCLK